jgi:hypothetical protein
MNASTIPILVPGRVEPVNVPFALEPAFGFDVLVFLPDWGVRAFSVALDSRDLTEAEVHDVQPHGADLMRRDLSEAERRAADEAAGDALRGVMARLGELPHASQMTAFRCTPLEAIARAYLAEEAAHNAAVAAHRMLPVAVHSPSLLDEDPTAADATWLSPSRRMLAAYVEWCFEEAQKAQAAKAQRQANEWARENVGDSAYSGCERGRF